MDRESRYQVGRSLVSRHSMQSYIPTYYRLRKMEPLIALAWAPTRGVGVGAWGAEEEEYCFHIIVFCTKYRA